MYNTPLLMSIASGSLYSALSSYGGRYHKDRLDSVVE